MSWTKQVVIHVDPADLGFQYDDFLKVHAELSEALKANTFDHIRVTFNRRNAWELCSITPFAELVAIGTQTVGFDIEDNGRRTPSALYSLEDAKGMWAEVLTRLTTQEWSIVKIDLDRNVITGTKLQGALN